MVVAAIILAGGFGRRMGGHGPVTKVLAIVDGQPMIRRPVQAALDSGLRPVIVVTGHTAPEVETAVAGLPILIAHSTTPDEGMAASLRAGIAAVPADALGVAVLLGDMPGVTADHLGRLREAFRAAPDAIVAPTVDGRRGNPVLWPRSLFPELLEVTGDVGGRDVLHRHADRLVSVPMDGCSDAGRGVMEDIDTAEDLDAWRAAWENPKGCG